MSLSRFTGPGNNQPLTSSAASDALSAMQKKQDAGNAAITLPQLPVAAGPELSGTGAGEEARDQGHYQPWEQDPDSLLPFLTAGIALDDYVDGKPINGRKIGRPHV